MITTIIIRDSKIRDAIVSISSGVKQTSMDNDVIFYQKKSLIFAFSEILPINEIYKKAIEEYQSEQVFIIETARSIDTEHEIGDVLLPNVFLNFNEKIIETEIKKDNMDKMIGNAKFLEIFDEHKDYFVEDFGLTIGAIVVQNTPENNDLNEKLMSVYNADAYTKNNLDDAYEIIKNSTISTLLLVGVVEWKKSKNSNKNPMVFLAENLLTTIRLLREDENL